MVLRRAVVVRGRPGLVGTMARTAVVAGTATAVSHSVSNRMAGPAQAQAPAPQPSAPSQQTEADVSTQIQNLANLKASGALSEEEFQTAKQRLLNS